MPPSSSGSDAGFSARRPGFDPPWRYSFQCGVNGEHVRLLPVKSEFESWHWSLDMRRVPEGRGRWLQPTETTGSTPARCSMRH